MALLGGCSVIPPETVKLSSTIGDQIVAIEKSHKTYINKNFDILEANANSLINEVYMPKLIGAAMNGASGKMLMEALVDAKTNPNPETTSKAIAITGEFLKLVKTNVDQERNQVLTPIKKNKSDALANVDAAYEQVLRGNSTITAYLTSIVKVRETQDQILSTVGVPGLQDKIANSVSKASDDIESLTKEAKAKNTGLDEVKNKVQGILSTLNQ